MHGCGRLRQCGDMYLGGCVDTHTSEIYRCVYNALIINDNVCSTLAELT